MSNNKKTSYETYFECEQCGYIYDYFEVMQANIDLLEECPRCHIGKFIKKKYIEPHNFY